MKFVTTALIAILLICCGISGIAAADDTTNEIYIVYEILFESLIFLNDATDSGLLKIFGIVVTAAVIYTVIHMLVTTPRYK